MTSTKVHRRISVVNNFLVWQVYHATQRGISTPACRFNIMAILLKFGDEGIAEQQHGTASYPQAGIKAAGSHEPADASKH